MKIVKLISLLVLLLIVVSTVNSTKNRFFTEALTKTARCEKVFTASKDKNVSDPAAQPSKNDIFNAEFTTSEFFKKNEEKALAQTKAARNVFYKPNDAVKALISEVATNLLELWGKTDWIQWNVVSFIDDASRQASATGTMQDDYKEYNLVFNNAKNEVLYSSTEVKTDTVNQVIEKAKTGTDPAAILGLLGFVGDIGAAVQDTFGRKKSDREQETIAGVMAQYVKDLKVVSADFYQKYSPDIYYNSDSQSKPGERQTCFDKTEDKTVKVDGKDTTIQKNKMVLDVRSGVMNKGDEADTALKVTKKLPKIGWPWQTIPKKLYDFCPMEPWAGHFSGSHYELMLMLQIFSSKIQGGDGKKLFDAKATISEDKKKVIAGLASAFLAATGMHSAIEFYWVVGNYLGTSQNPKIDIANLDKNSLLCLNATKDISKLMTDLTTSRRKKILRKSIK